MEIRKNRRIEKLFYTSKFTHAYKFTTAVESRFIVHINLQRWASQAQEEIGN